MRAKSKLSTIVTLISQALIDLDIGHEKFKTFVNKKEKYERMKEDIRMMKSSNKRSENTKRIKVWY